MRNRQTIAWITALVLLGAGLIGCAETDDPPAAVSPPPAASSPATTPPPSTAGPDSSGETMSETPIRIVIGDQTLDARLWDNPAARSFLDQLPVTLDFEDYGRQEVLATPPQPLTMDGMPAGESAPAGTIGYYAPDNVIVLYYTDVPRYGGIVRIGQIDGDTSILTGWDAARPVTFERVI